MSTSVPQPTLTDTGFATPDEATILAGIMADLQAAFGGGLNPSLATPQGQLATSLSALTGAVNDLFLFYTNQIDPITASGRMQDAIARIYFLTRKAAQPTTVIGTATGAVGTVIPLGSLAQATDGTIYQTTVDATIGQTGTVDIPFAAVTTGPTDCPAGSLTTIYRSIPGWDAITNSADGTPGTAVESRADFEGRRADSVSLNGTGILPALRGTVLNVDGVTDAYITENSSDTDLAIGAVTIAPHSLYACVAGGTDADVARAIWTKKNPGCDYTGNTTVTVEDTSSGYQIPYPSYDVTFQRPAATPVYFDVVIASSNLVPADAESQIETAIANAFVGGDGQGRAAIGGTVYASRFYAAIASLGIWARIVSLTVGFTSSPTGTEVTLGIDQQPVTGPSYIDVSVS